MKIQILYYLHTFLEIYSYNNFVAAFRDCSGRKADFSFCMNTIFIITLTYSWITSGHDIPPEMLVNLTTLGRKSQTKSERLNRL